MAIQESVPFSLPDCGVVVISPTPAASINVLVIPRFVPINRGLHPIDYLTNACAIGLTALPIDRTVLTNSHRQCGQPGKPTKLQVFHGWARNDGRNVVSLRAGLAG